jgi:flagellar assembly factor FliW
VVADPGLFVEDYWSTLAMEDLRDCNLNPFEIPIFLVIVTVPATNPYEISANLLAPLVISPSTRVGRQVVLSHSGYASHYPIFETVQAALADTL